MRIAAAGFAAILASLALMLGAGASPDQSSPFPSPSPVASAGPASGGYAVIGVSSLTAAGGQIPAASATSTPTPFKATGATGYAIDIFSRISGTYAARLRYRDVSVHGDDHPIVSRFDGGFYYTGGGRAGIGLGIASEQRSSAGASSNGFGVGAFLMPDFAKRLSPYIDADVYPSLPAPGGKRGSLETFDAGLVFVNPGGSSTFERLGVDSQIFSPITSSPTSLWGVELGIGATF